MPTTKRARLYVIRNPKRTVLCSFCWTRQKGGEILFERKNITEMGLEKHRHDGVSFVLQNYNLVEYMTPRKNVQLVNAHASGRYAVSGGSDGRGD